MDHKALLQSILKKHISVIFIFIIMVACAPMSVKINVEKSYDFSNRKTYTLLPNEQDDLVNLALNKEEINTIVTSAIDTQLTEKGYQKSSSNPDILVSYYLVSNTKTDTYYVNQYYGNLGYRLTPGRSSTRESFQVQESTYEEGILIIDIIDAASNNRVWQGFLTSRVEIYKDKERKERRLRNAVIKIISHVPAQQS